MDCAELPGSCDWVSMLLGLFDTKKISSPRTRNYVFIFAAQQPNSILGRLIVEVYRLHAIRHTHTHTHTHAHTHTHTYVSGCTSLIK